MNTPKLDALIKGVSDNISPIVAIEPMTELIKLKLKVGAAEDMLATIVAAYCNPILNEKEVCNEVIDAVERYKREIE